MNRVIVSGWNSGFNKIEANKIFRTHLGYDLREAKDAVDAILNGKTLEFELAEGPAARLHAELGGVGALCRLEHSWK